VGGLSQPVEPYTETAAQIQTSQVATQVELLNDQLGQVPRMRGASQGPGRNVQLIHPNMIYGNQSNSLLFQQSNNSQVHTPPAITVAQETRLVPSRFQRRSLERAGLNHRQEHRNFSLPLGTAQNVTLATSSCLHTKQSMGSPVAPSAKRGQPDASGPRSQAGSSETFGPQPNASANMGAYKSESDEKAGNTQPPGFQSPSGLVNMLYPLPVLSPLADANGNLLRQRQIANPRPDGYIIVPGEYTPIPALLPHPVSSSPIQVEQSGRTILQSQKSKEFKTRVAIAISGSPASGKSTLVYLLAAVFEGATIRDTGYAGAQTMYPVFNGRVEENPNKKGPITKVFVIHQNSYIKPVAEWPMAEWSELYPYSPAMEVINPHIGAARTFAKERCNRSYERYWEAAYKANIGVDPGLVSNSSSSHFPQLVAPTPIRISKKGPNLDCRGAVDWVKFGKAINDGMRGHKNEEGMLETEEGQEKIEAYLGQTHPNTGIPLVNSRKLEPLRERIREWIRKETAQNDRIGFPGRSVVDGSLREMLILDGSLLYLQSHPNKGAGGEKLMKAFDVKLFLSTLETEAIQRCFSQREYLDPPQGTRQPEETWMFEGYISEVAW
jgi:energy-coupling factor transporter ATP-binding protein EcfA2